MMLGRKIATAAVFLAIIAGLWWNQDRGLKAVATETHAALCTFKEDLEGRQEASKKYVLDVTEGRRQPIAGITLAEIRVTNKNRQNTLDALASLNCS
jgi:hypothetical protein